MRLRTIVAVTMFTMRHAVAGSDSKHLSTQSVPFEVVGRQVELRRDVDKSDGGGKSYSSKSGYLADAKELGGSYVRVSAWGAFVYGLTSSVGELMNQCDWCWDHHRNHPGFCAVDLQNLARALTVATVGVLVGTGAYEQKRHEAPGRPSTSSMSAIWQYVGYFLYILAVNM